MYSCFSEASATYLNWQRSVNLLKFALFIFHLSNDTKQIWQVIRPWWSVKGCSFGCIDPLLDVVVSFFFSKSLFNEVSSSATDGIFSKYEKWTSVECLWKKIVGWFRRTSTNLFHQQLDFCFTSDFLFIVFQVKLLQNGIEIYTWPFFISMKNCRATSCL